MAEATAFHSHAGVDIHAVFGDTIFGELQMIAYRIDREKAPVYTLGSSAPRTIARGKRMIQGSLVFVSFDRDSLLENMTNQDSNIKPFLNAQDAANAPGGSNSANQDKAVAQGGSWKPNAKYTGVGQLTSQTSAYIADQLLPFDVTLVAANEYGIQSEMKIIGIELMTEGSGVSIDDLVIEKQHAFIARHVQSWKAIERTT